MTAKERTLTVRVDEEMSEAIEAVREKHGTPVSEQVRRALRAWLVAQGVIKKAERKRAATRRRP
jgi:antitoxin component of RelBE/YafQ-DinJ toxin-antitoxin module